MKHHRMQITLLLYANARTPNRAPAIPAKLEMTIISAPLVVELAVDPMLVFVPVPAPVLLAVALVLGAWVTVGVGRNRKATCSGTACSSS